MIGPLFICAAFLFPGLLLAEAVRVGLFDTGSAHTHQAQVQKILADQFKAHCPSCQVMNFPIYSSTGALEEKRFLNALHEAVENHVQIFHFSWNMESTPRFNQVEKELQKISRQEVVLVAAAGENPQNTQIPLKLKSTVMGKIKNIFVIGELNEQGYLEPRSNYGPELFTALKTPVQSKGSSFSSALFTANVAIALSHKTMSEIKKTLIERKLKSPETYPSLSELFKFQ